MIKYCKKHQSYFSTYDDSKCPECVEEEYALATVEDCGSAPKFYRGDSMTKYGVDEMDEYLKVADVGEEGSPQETIEWVKNNPLKAAKLLWYYENDMREKRR